jgi:hypothetical protein
MKTTATTMHTDDADVTDPVLVKRAKIAKWVSLGQRTGYGLYALCCVLFGYTVVTKPTSWAIQVIIVAFAIGSVVLLPAIIFGYAVKAAERHDRELAQLAAAKKQALADKPND